MPLGAGCGIFACQGVGLWTGTLAYGDSTYLDTGLMGTALIGHWAYGDSTYLDTGLMGTAFIGTLGLWGQHLLGHWAYEDSTYWDTGLMGTALIGTLGLWGHLFCVRLGKYASMQALDVPANYF